MRRFEGVIHLPRAELVAKDALGRTFAGRTEGVHFELAYPQLPDAVADDQAHILDPPYAVEGFVTASVQNGGGHWGYTGFTRGSSGDEPRSLASWVSCVAVKITVTSADDSIAVSDLADQFGPQFDAWYAIALQWIELWSDVVLSRDQEWRPSSSGQVRDIDQPPSEGLTGWGVSLAPATLLSSQSALSVGMLTSAFAKASAGEAVPTPWGLFLRSRRAADQRIAVIEVATAVEVALTRALDSRLSALSASSRQVIVKQANGLIGLLTLLETIDAVPGNESLLKRVKDRLAGPRNDAAHRGLSPTESSVVSDAYEVARAVLERYSPLPQPGGYGD